ncbi:MAG: hypothetical protein ACR5LD_00490 [Symbiopectobacterium sp.]
MGHLIVGNNLAPGDGCYDMKNALVKVILFHRFSCEYYDEST